MSKPKFKPGDILIEIGNSSNELKIISCEKFFGWQYEYTWLKTDHVVNTNSCIHELFAPGTIKWATSKYIDAFFLLKTINYNRYWAQLNEQR